MSGFDVVLPVSPEDREPSYLDLYGQSMLRYTSVRLQYLDQLAKQLIELSSVPGVPIQAAKPREKHKKSHDLIIDICEKLGFVWLASNEIERIQSKPELIDGAEWFHIECGRVKYHLYNCIFNAKAVSDSVSVLLNHLFGLEYESGRIDFIKERKFRRDLIERSNQLGELWKNHAAWFNGLGRFRDAMIHRQSLPVFVPYAKTRVVFDFRPVEVRIVDGKERFHFDLAMGTSGKSPQETSKFKGQQAVVQWKVNYVTPKDVTRYSELSGRGRLTFDDFQDTLGFCRLAFTRLRELSEIAFSVTFNQITKSNI